MWSTIFNTFLYRPLFNLLVLICAYVPGHDLGIAIIILTILIRIALYPFFLKSLRSQTVMNKIQPELQEIRKRYKQDPTKQSKELLVLYQKHHINPLSSFALLIIQFPVLIALFQVFRGGVNALTASQYLYSFVSLPVLHTSFLGILDLTHPNLVLAILTALVQFYQTKLSMGKISQDQSKPSLARAIQKSTLYFLPLMTFLFLTNLNAAIGLYWLTTTVFSLGQQYLIWRSSSTSPVSN